MIKVFVPPAKDVKMSIDRLITKDLLQRDEKDRELIRYKDWFICTKLYLNNKTCDYFILIKSRMNKNYSCHRPCFYNCLPHNSFGWQEKWKEKWVLVFRRVYRKQWDVRICEIFVISNFERNFDSSILCLTVKENSPVFPVECSIYINLINIIFVCYSIFSQSKEISLPNFTIVLNFSNRFLNFDICNSTPIGIILFTASNPLSFLINKISDRINYDIS